MYLTKKKMCIFCSDLKVIAEEATTAVKLGKVKATYISCGSTFYQIKNQWIEADMSQIVALTVTVDLRMTTSFLGGRGAEFTGCKRKIALFPSVVRI